MTNDAIDRASLLTRRKVLQGAAGMALGASGLAVLGCGSDSEAGGTAAGTATAVPDGNPGGTAQLLLVGGGPTLVLDPATQVNEPDALVNGMLYDGLVRIGDEWEVENRLATSIDHDGSLKSWTIGLREGVTFHDGREMTADDVVFSLRRILDAKLGSAVYARLAPELKASGIKKVDKHTVQIDLVSADAFLPIALGSRQLKIIPANTSSFDRPIGTGPFRLKSVNQGELSFSLEKFPDYWEAGVPLLDGVTGLLSNDQTSLIQRVSNGAFTFGGPINPAAAATVESGGATQLLKHKSALYNDLVLAANEEPFTNPKVREACKLAIDRQEVLELAYHGFGSVTYDVPIRRTDPFFNKELASRKRDVDRARELLREAGYPNGLDLTLQTADAGSGMVDLAVVAAESLAEAGIRAKIHQAPADTYYDVVWLKQPFYVDTWVQRHPYDALSVSFLKKAPWNEAKFYSDAFDETMAEARRVGELSMQKEALDRAQTMVADNAGFVCPAWLDELYVGQPQLSGVTFNATDLVSFDRASVT